MLPLLLSLLAIAQAFNVDVFFGTEGGGNVFPGSTRPFGMVKLGVDTIESASGNAYSGYAPDGRVLGISLLHESGTGGAPQYGVVSQLPWLGDINYTSELALTRASPDTGLVGHYQANFTNGAGVELAAATRLAILHYDFGTDFSQPPKIVVNASHHLAAPARPWWSQYFVEGTLYTNVSDHHYGGHSTFKGGWGDQLPWTIYYCGDFDTEPQAKTFFQGKAPVYTNDSVSSAIQDDSFGVVYTFSPESRSIRSRVGVSFKSIDQACLNIYDDFGDDYDVDATVEETVNLWNEQLFDRVEVKTDNSSLKGIVYTALYGTHLLPSNRTGEHPSDDWGDKVYYDDWFTIWDTFRCLNPLFNVLNPTIGGELVQSLANIYQHDGYTPDGRSANQNGRTQGGSNSDIVMADAYVKGIEGVDWNLAFDAMVKNAEVAPPYVYDLFAPDASNKQGRGALPDWKQYGYITRNYTRSVTRTMEYAYDDFALAVVAKGLNDNRHDKYLKRSSNWQNIWNPDASSDKVSYKGFVQPKNSDGTFNYTNYNPMECGGCYWGDDEYEGKPVEYLWAVPFDIETLKTLIGSDSTFEKRLDDMYALYGAEDIADVGNEPSFLTPYLYNYINKNHKTVATTRYIIHTKFGSGVKGLPGNSDAGAMQAWYFFLLIGVYPVAGTTTYLLLSPFLEETTINLENGNKATIKANNLGPDSYYVQSVTLNGETLAQNWITHDFFVDGGELVFELGQFPVLWETGVVPPSPGHYERQ